MLWVTVFNIPPQNHGVKRHQDFGFEKNETRSGQAFSKDISKLITSGDVLDLKIFANNFLTNKMIINFYMLCTSMKNRIRGDAAQD